MVKKALTVFVLLVGVVAYAASKMNVPISQHDLIQPYTQKTQSSLEPSAIPIEKDLENDYHIYQAFNNCGPASLSMALSHYDIRVSQEELGQKLRPYQNARGDNDDKSVTLEEMGEKAKDYNLIPYHRPDGDIELLIRLIALDVPVITRTWLQTDEDIGHYRVVTGYDESARELIQDDSYQGPNRRYSYEEFNALWSKFGYEYLVLVPPDRKRHVEQALGDEVDVATAWRNAMNKAQHAIAKNPDDATSRFNLSIALYHLGHFKESVAQYEIVKDKLPFRTLWYQIEPIQAYYELEAYDRIFSITNDILSNQNRAYSELYIIRGDSYKKLNNPDAAREEYDKALYYNENLQIAKDRLSRL